MAGDLALRFGVLGPMVVERGGATVNAGHPRQRAVLALLLIHANQPLSTDAIADALWGESPPESAAATIQVYISNLRRALEPDRPARTPPNVLLTTGGGYQLSIPRDSVDAHRFTALVEEASETLGRDPGGAREMLVAALQLWRGPALADFRYHDFAQAEVARLDELRATALEFRVQADLESGRAPEVVQEIDRLVREYPLRERLRAHQMLALYRAGRQAEALAAFRRYSNLLRDELGLEPTPALRELELAILEHDPSLEFDPGAEPARIDGRPDPAPELVGRGLERARFADALDGAAGGRGSVLLLDGEAGIGKTRLLESFRRVAEAAGAATAFARCVEVGGAPPFWPWTQLADQLDDAADGATDRVTALLTDRPPDGTPPRTLHQVAGLLAGELAKLGEDRPVVLLLDDVYSADPDSLALLTLVGGMADRLPVVLVGTHRGATLGPEHPLTDVLVQLSRLPHVERLHVRPLDATEVGQVVAELTATDVDSKLASAIHARTSGNAFFTVELVRVLHARGGLDPASVAAAIPGSVRELIVNRVEQLGHDTVSLLRYGAVAGREFDVSVLASALGIDLDTSLHAIDEAVRAGLLSETARPGTYRFSHVIVVDALTRSLGALRAASIHVQLADAIERDRADDPAAWVEIAHHRVEGIPAGGVAAAIEALARAGRHAMEAGALALAEQHFERRVELVAELPDSPSKVAGELAALMDVVRALTWSEGYHAARIGAAVDRAWALSRLDWELPVPNGPVTADDPMLSLLQARFSYEVVGGDLVAAAETVGRYVELARHGDAMLQLGARISAMVLHVHEGDPAAALRESELAREALDVLDRNGTAVVMLPLGQQAARVTFHSFTGWANYLAGDTDKAQLELRESRRWCERLGHEFSSGFCVAVEGIVAAMTGSAEYVAEVLAWGRERFGDDVFGLFRIWHGVLHAWADGIGSGDPAGAADAMRSLVGELEANGAEIAHTLYWALIAELELRAGHADRALAATRRGLDHVQSRGERFWHPDLERLAAEAHRRLGDARAQQAAYRRAVGAADALGIVPLQHRLATLAG